MDIQLLQVHPQEIKFIFEEKKQSLSSIKLTNNTPNYVAFKVKTTQPQKYNVGPNMGIIQPLSTCEVKFNMREQNIAPPDMICKDKFLIQSTVVSSDTTPEDITSNTNMFGRHNSSNIEEMKLATILVRASTSSPSVEALSVGVLDQSDKQIKELKLKITQLDKQLHQARLAISKLERERNSIKKTKSFQKINDCSIL